MRMKLIKVLIILIRDPQPTLHISRRSIFRYFRSYFHTKIVIRKKLTDTIVYVIRNIQPIKTDPLSRVLRMISEAGRGGGCKQITHYIHQRNKWMTFPAIKYHLEKKKPHVWMFFFFGTMFFSSPFWIYHHWRCLKRRSSFSLG